jgi:hypothetical protein
LPIRSPSATGRGAAVRGRASETEEVGRVIPRVAVCRGVNGHDAEGAGGRGICRSHHSRRRRPLSMNGPLATAAATIALPRTGKVTTSKTVNRPISRARKTVSRDL